MAHPKASRQVRQRVGPQVSGRDAAIERLVRAGMNRAELMARLRDIADRRPSEEAALAWRRVRGENAATGRALLDAAQAIEHVRELAPYWTDPEIATPWVIRAMTELPRLFRASAANAIGKKAKGRPATYRTTLLSDLMASVRECTPRPMLSEITAATGMEIEALRKIGRRAKLGLNSPKKSE